MNNCKFPEQWLPPFTAKRYIHPPFAEYMLTMWPDLRVMCGEVVEKTRGYHSSAFRVLCGDTLLPPDFDAVRYETRPDGVPIHALTQALGGGVELRMEAFGAFTPGSGRIPTAFCRMTLTNTTLASSRGSFAIMPRTGREDHLVGMEVDGYAHYDNNVHNWGFLQSAWAPVGGCPACAETVTLSDGEYSLRLQGVGAFGLRWQGKERGVVWGRRDLLLLAYDLAPGESVAFDAAFRIGETSAFDLDAERARSEAFWLGELGRVRDWPGLPAHRPLVASMVLQCLQMFCYPVGKDYVLPRQGGLQRVIWPCEAMEFLMALDRIGDFKNYTETAYETYFFRMQDMDGELAGAVRNLSGNPWGSITGGSCWSCARHILFLDDQASFAKFRDSMALGFRYMESQRAKTRDGSAEGVGLFPVMKSCDWPGEFQSWCLTDAINLEGYRWMAEAFERFGDPMAAEIRAAYDDYMACMKTVLANEVAKNDREDEILLTATVGIPMTDPPSGAYFSDGPAGLLRVGVIEPGSETMRLLENYFRNRGCFRNGLTGLMNDGLIFQGHNADPCAGHTWYTSFSDLNWYYAWLACGEYGKARETLEAQLRYGMSPEFYLNERYADNDPYWVPWMPNASANGRLLMMLCDCKPLYE